MSNYPLTLGADNIIGSDAADVFDGYNDDDGAGLTGGTDLLSGLAGTIRSWSIQSTAWSTER